MQEFAHFQRIIPPLTILIILSFMLERALFLVFDYRWFARHLSGKGLKTPIAFATSYLVCYSYDYDILQVVFKEESSTVLGLLLTSMIAAGGSKGAMSILTTFLNIKPAPRD